MINTRIVCWEEEREGEGGSVRMSWWPAPGQGPAARLSRRLLGPATPILLFARLTGGGRRQRGSGGEGGGGGGKGA